MSADPPLVSNAQPASDPRFDGMIAARRLASQNAITRAEKALRDMIRKGDAVTVSAVAARAGVSRGWLSRHPDLGPKIRSNRAARAAPLATGNDESDPSPIAALREHIRRQQLHHERELSKARARAYELEQQLQAALGEVIRLRENQQHLRGDA